MSRSSHPTRALLAALVALFTLLPIGAGAGTDPVPCPVLGEPVLLGPLGQKETRAPFSARHLSGLAVSTDNADALTGQQIVWAVGDRKANEAVKVENDRVYLFGYDVADGSLAIRYRIRPGAFPDDPRFTGPPEPDGVTSTDSVRPVPDVEDLSIEYREGARDLLWLFDTGDNTVSRDQINAYRVWEPDLTQTGIGVLGETGTDPELDDESEGGAIKPARFPIKVWNNAKRTNRVHPNVEAAFVDVGAPVATKPIYLIPRTPADADGDGSFDELRLYRFDTRKKNGANHATPAGWLEAGGPGHQVVGASIVPGGATFALRTGKATQDAVLTFDRDPARHISEWITDGNRTPACSWVGNDTDPGAAREETIAFAVPAASTGPWEGFVWTHDGTEFPPLYGAAIEVPPEP
ncbi:MAG: hypothetical protein WD739_11900 [Actinomycetota bacterium]